MFRFDQKSHALLGSADAGATQLINIGLISWIIYMACGVVVFVGAGGWACNQKHA